ncbi:hypothetical protein AALP_AAs44024U000100, partial [Arabis alpina]
VGFSLAFVIHESANSHIAVLGRLPGCIRRVLDGRFGINNNSSYTDLQSSNKLNQVHIRPHGSLLRFECQGDIDHNRSVQK